MGDKVSSSSNGMASVPDNVKSSTDSCVDAHLQQLQQLHELQQQQIQQLQLIQQQLAAGHDPNVVLSSQDVTSLTRNPEAAAAALVDPRTSNKVPEMLRRSSLEFNDDDDSLLNEDASATAIATASDRLHNSAMTIDEYMRHNNGDVDDRSAKMDDVSKCSWVRSFQSIDSCSMTSAHSLGKIGGGDNDKDLNGRQKKMGHAKSMKDSKMSMISELTDFDNDPCKSNRSLSSRARKMNDAKTLNSNISMFSELTDMTGDFSTLSLKK